MAAVRASNFDSAAEDREKAAAFIGCLISLTTKCLIRYEGFLFQLDPQASILGLRNVKSFGTEDRRLDGTQVAPSNKIYEYVLFRGSDIKDLQVISTPPIESSPALPDDPAIIQPHKSHPPLNISLVTPNALGGSSNANLAVQAPPLQGMATPLPSVDVSGSWASLVPAAQVNISGPVLQSYWPGFTGLPAGNSHFQPQPFPPPPPSLLLANPLQLQLPHHSVNASLAGNALNFAEPPPLLLPPVCTGSLNLSSTVSPASTEQYSHLSLSTIFSNLSSAPMSNNASIAFQTEMVQSGAQMVSSPITTSDINLVAPPVTNRAQSLLGPAPFQMILEPSSSTVGRLSSFRGKPLPVPPGLMQPSPSGYFRAGNSGANFILPLASNLPLSDSENVDKSAMQLPKPPARRLHQGASSSHFGNMHHGLGRGDVIPGGMFYPGQSYRGHALGRDQGILPHGAVSQYYQTDRGHPAGRGSGMIGPSSYPRHMAREQPNTSFRHRSGGTPVWGGIQAEINFNEDFDFEAMNEKFNKEEIWGLLSKKNQQAGPVDEKVGDGRAEDRAGVPKAEHKPGYCKEDFFDSISCEALDALSEKEKTNSSEARNLVSETTGETEGPQLSHGVQEPPTGGVSPGSYGGRGYENSGRSRGKAVWNPGA